MASATWINTLIHEMFNNNSLIKTYTQPHEVVPCAPITISALQLHYLPGIIQCALLYPYLDRFKWVRRIRWALTPLSIYYSLKLPVDYCFTPTSKRGYHNLALACASFVMVARSIEWGTLQNYQHGKFFKRSEFNSNPSYSHRPSSPSKVKQIQEFDSFSYQDWLGWTLEILSSVRGQQFEWGMKIPPHRESAINLVKQMYILNIIHVLATGFSILCKDQGSSIKAMKYLGLANFYGERILSEGIENLAFGFYLITMIEIGFSYMTLFIHFINFLNLNNLIKFPNWLLKSFNLNLFSPLFNSPHLSTSLAYLWGKAWHQMFRQSFLTLGGFPASNLAKKLGCSLKVQRLSGMIGCFIISAVLHEYAIHFAARQPHPNAHIFYHEFPGSFIYFILQPIGILIEPFIIPYIPGGGTLWVYFFTLLTVTPFRRSYFKGQRFIYFNYNNNNSSSSINFNWFFISFLIPCYNTLF